MELLYQLQMVAITWTVAGEVTGEDREHMAEMLRVIAEGPQRQCMVCAPEGSRVGNVSVDYTILVKVQWT